MNPRGSATQMAEKQEMTLRGHPSGLLPHRGAYSHPEVTQHRHVKQAASSAALIGQLVGWEKSSHLRTATSRRAGTVPYGSPHCVEKGCHTTLAKEISFLRPLVSPV